MDKLNWLTPQDVYYICSKCRQHMTSEHRPLRHFGVLLVPACASRPARRDQLAFAPASQRQPARGLRACARAKRLPGSWSKFNELGQAE